MQSHAKGLHLSRARIIHRPARIRTRPLRASAGSPAQSAAGGGDGGNAGSGGGGGGGDGDDDDFVNEEEVRLPFFSSNRACLQHAHYAPCHKAMQAIALAAAAGTKLPPDLLAEAAAGGLKRSAAAAYIALQSSFLAGWLARTVPWFRDRLIYDNRFLFKVGAEIVIDSGCATFAEVRKRGSEFWDEFEFYLSDLLVGLVMDVVLVGLMAPVAVLGRARPVGKSSACPLSPTL